MSSEVEELKDRFGTKHIGDRLNGLQDILLKAGKDNQYDMLDAIATSEYTDHEKIALAFYWGWKQAEEKLKYKMMRDSLASMLGKQ